VETAALTDRLMRARAGMSGIGIDALLVAAGSDLVYLTGYEAMDVERLTMLFVPVDGDAVLLVPRVDALRVEEHPDVFRVELWDEQDDPIALVATYTQRLRTIGVSDQTWARFVLLLQDALPDVRFCSASRVTGPLRAVKDAHEIEALGAAAQAVDTIAVELRDMAFGGRTERDVQRDLVERMLDVGHERANFAIVGSGPNAASPHHEAGSRVVVEGDVVLCDFGGTMRGYCSDITRMFAVGGLSSEVSEAYAALVEAQEVGVRAAVVGAACEDVDAAARGVLTDAGYGAAFVHRTGHGIGIQTHEDPYLVAGNTAALEVGHAFSIEPGIYVPGRYGLRLEDIVVATDGGPLRLNDAPRDLAIVG
jgi:Xaa-Pro aminopeptidase